MKRFYHVSSAPSTLQQLSPRHPQSPPSSLHDGEFRDPKNEISYTIKLDQATRDGATLLYILTNVPARKASAKRGARLYRKRWTLETAFQHLEAYFHAEVNTLAYPKAAVFGFCLALVAYNLLAVVLAALRSVHGQERVAEEVSLYYIANDLSTTYTGMMIAIPEVEWDVFYRMSAPEMVAT